MNAFDRTLYSRTPHAHSLRETYRLRNRLENHERKEEILRMSKMQLINEEKSFHMSKHSHNYFISLISSSVVVLKVKILSQYCLNSVILTEVQWIGRSMWELINLWSRLFKGQIWGVQLYLFIQIYIEFYIYIIFFK